MKAMSENPLNTNHSLSGVNDLTCILIGPMSLIQGAYKLFTAHQQFANMFYPTKTEVDRCHNLTLDHVQVLAGYVEEEF